MSTQQTVELYTWLGHHFNMPGSEEHSDGLYLGITTGPIAGTDGYSVSTIIVAAYNIGLYTRTHHSSVDDTVLEEAYNLLRADQLKYCRPGDGIDLEHDWEVFRAIDHHKDIILRAARELWDLFPEIYQKYGQDHPSLTPEQFFGFHCPCDLRKYINPKD